MRILFDGFIYSIQSAGGINRYVKNLIEHLPDDVTPILLASHGSPVHFPRRDNMELIVSRAGQRFHKPLRRVGRWISRRKFLKLQQSVQADLLHATYYHLLSRQLPSQSPLPTVITVYDMIHERFSELLDPRGKEARAKRQWVAQADRVICISENTRRDLLQAHAVDPSKVVVIPLATNIGSVQPEPENTAPSYPFYLYVGSRAGYKNFNRLLEALQVVVRQFPSIRLCVAGPPFRADERRRIDELSLRASVVHDGVPDDRRLARLYRSSIALVYPSRYEGFGIPPLEAMSCGTPVVAANTSSIPEVVGDAAALFEPEDTKQLAEILCEVAGDQRVRQRWIEAGRARATLFSWERTVEETMRLYRSLINVQR